jgi:hypothetical protein
MSKFVVVKADMSQIHFQEVLFKQQVRPQFVAVVPGGGGICETRPVDEIEDQDTPIYELSAHPVLQQEVIQELRSL